MTEEAKNVGSEVEEPPARGNAPTTAMDAASSIARHLTERLVVRVNRDIAEGKPLETEIIVASDTRPWVLSFVMSDSVPAPMRHPIADDWEALVIPRIPWRRTLDLLADESARNEAFLLIVALASVERSADGRAKHETLDIVATHHAFGPLFHRNFEVRRTSSGSSSHFVEASTSRHRIDAVLATFLA